MAWVSLAEGPACGKMAAPSPSEQPARTMQYDLLDLYGETWLEEQILAERHLTQIAEEAGVAVSHLLRWIDREPGRRDRIDEIRRKCAQMWEERAERIITEAKTSFELTKARDLAHHYRWRASRIAPKKYGDKVTQDHVSSDGSMSPKTFSELYGSKAADDGDA